MRDKEKYNEYMKRYMRSYKDNSYYTKKLVYNREFNLKRKIIALTHYSFSDQLMCTWVGCNVDDVDMLTIDHINDDGAKHRKDLTNGKHRCGGGFNIYNWLIKNNFPDGYQTLCHNHQWKKEILRRRLLSE